MPFHSGNFGDFATLSGGNRLAADAKNRAVRTFLQGLAIDLAVAVAAFVLANVDSITDKQGLILALTALGKTVATTGASYVMRRFLDPSRVPTPLPPSDPGEPDNEVGNIDIGTAIVIVMLGLIFLAALGVFGPVPR